MRYGWQGEKSQFQSETQQNLEKSMHPEILNNLAMVN